jgi:tetratricopeptide (TPR) repeat protein
LAFGTIQRNIVWRTEESLWRDVTIKSPRNARGVLNYAVAELNKGEFEAGLVDLKRAKILAPQDGLVDLNLGVAGAKLHRPDAEEHFRLAVQRLYADPRTHHFYARWLEDNGRRAEAIEQLRIGLKMNPDYLDSMYLLMEIFAKRQAWATVRGLSELVLKPFPADEDAKAFRLMASLETGQEEASTRSLKTADVFLELSKYYFRIGNYERAVSAGREALRLRPEYAEAYNNISAAYRGLENWDLAIDAARRALKIRPNFGAAQKNLALSEDKRKPDMP